MRIVLLGPPGAGKGTLANLIKEKYDAVHISTGDMLREEMKSGSEMGKQINGLVDRGELVPDEVITKIVENRMNQDRESDKGFLLDGFPRTRIQAEELERILNHINKPINYVLNLEVTLPVIIGRLTGRRVCRECSALYHMTNKPPKVPEKCDVCNGPIYQRADDNEETIKTRMEVYTKSSAPIVEYYQERGKLHNVDSNGNSQEMFKQTVQIINEGKRSDQDKITPRA